MKSEVFWCTNCINMSIIHESSLMNAVSVTTDDGWSEGKHYTKVHIK